MKKQTTTQLIEKINRLGYEVKTFSSLDKTFYAVVKEGKLINTLNRNELENFINFQEQNAEQIINDSEGLNFQEKSDLNLSKVIKGKEKRKYKTLCPSCLSRFEKERFLFNYCPICKNKNLKEIV